MDPVSNIVLAAIGWIAKPIFKKAVDAAWQQFTKGVALNKVTDELIAELKNFEVPSVETVEMKDYLKEVKELVHEAKDLLDELDYFRLQKEVKSMNQLEGGNILTRFKSKGIASSSTTSGSFKEMKFDRRGLYKRMKELIAKLKEKKCESLYPTLPNQLLSQIVNGIDMTNDPVVRNDRERDSYLLEDKIYGRHNEIRQIQEIIKHAEQHPEEIHVMALVGHGGYGKTTLAQKVCKDLTPSFNPKMWITVSTNFDEKEIICQMLKHCKTSFDNNSNKNLLKKELEECLKEKKFLVVLDDIWNMSETEWKSLLAPLKSHTGLGSMVLVTTRDPSIAKLVSTTDHPPIDLDRLDDDSFWSFFINCAFGNDGHNVPPVLEDIGRRIIEKLSGNPLAAKTVGNLLRSENNTVKWTEILDREEWKFQEGKGDIIPILTLSYEYLPIHLKRCFSYCSLFPKDHPFKAEQLVYMWMAQDFINTNDKRVKNIHQKKDHKRMEDVGFEYLYILVQRAFFQKVVTAYGSVVYVIHDLMHDLAQTVSSDEILAINYSINKGVPPVSSNFHHLSFLLDVNYTIEKNVQFQNLCSLVIFGNNNTLEETLEWDKANRVGLRLLILPHERSISYNFSLFLHLRYLKLNSSQYSTSGEEKTTFPVQICKLYHLQVLELEHPWRYAEELPREFNNLVNLRHFIANRSLHSRIAGVGRLKHLQELEEFVVREEKGFELRQLSELNELRGSLGIYNLENVKGKEEAESARISENKIVELELFWTKNNETVDIRKTEKYRGKWRKSQKKRDITEHFSASSSERVLEALQPNSNLIILRIDNYGGCSSPSWLMEHSIKYLESITLSNCEAWEVLPNFGQLKGLKELYLSKLPRVKAFGAEFHGRSPKEGFPSLKVMEVIGMAELKTWVWSQGYEVFPFLEKLTVRKCRKLSEFSLLNPVGGTQWFPKLDSLTIKKCPELEQAVPSIFPFIYPSQINDAEINASISTCIYYTRPSSDLRIHCTEETIVREIVMSFQNICSMYVSLCHCLTPLSWKCICMLRSLKRLNFTWCHVLCFAPAVEEEKDDGTTFYSHESLEELIFDECEVSGKVLSFLLAHLPAIRKLKVCCCRDIDSVWLPSDNIDEPNIAPLEEAVEVHQEQQPRPGNSLACLEELKIFRCPNMFFANEGGLSGLTALKKVTIFGSEKLLYSMNENKESNYVHTLIVKESNVTSLKLCSFVALQKLKLYECRELIAVEGTNSHTCVKVSIKECPQLATTSKAKTQDPIHPEFTMPVGNLKTDNADFLSFHARNFAKSLQSLTFAYSWKLSTHSWTEWTAEQENALIKHLPALQQLTLLRCSELRSLPGTLNKHPSLKELTIHDCPEIKSLPQRVLPQSLQELRLSDCSEELKSQCSQLEDFECSSTETDKYGNEVQVFLRKVPSLN